MAIRSNTKNIKLESGVFETQTLSEFGSANAETSLNPNIKLNFGVGFCKIFGI